MPASLALIKEVAGGSEERSRRTGSRVACHRQVYLEKRSRRRSRDRRSAAVVALTLPACECEKSDERGRGREGEGGREEQELQNRIAGEKLPRFARLMTRCLSPAACCLML